MLFMNQIGAILTDKMHCIDVLQKKSTSAVTDVMSYVCIWHFDVFYKEYTRFQMTLWRERDEATRKF